MTLPPIEFRCDDTQEIESFLAERIYEFNSRATGYFDAASFGAVQRDASGNIVAGISGYTWGGVCFVSYLWVDANHRAKGLGRTLLQMAEKNAIERRCAVVLLSTHRFQSPEFYVRMGYQQHASVSNHPVGYSNIFYAKRLDSPLG
jgi:GNAT superfamily N-acetyltransferase